MQNGLETAESARPRSARRRAWVVWLVLAVALTCGMIGWWYGGLRNRFEPVNFGIVEPGKLYRSGQISAPVIRKTLKSNHIGLILSLSGDDSEDLEAEKKASAELGVDRVYLGGLAGDGIGDPNVYPRALAEIVRANRSGKAVLVHCQSGAQRTGGVIAAYRILVEGEDPQKAFDEMHRYGHNPKHNPNLIPFIQAHLAQWKQQLARYEASAASQPSTMPL